MRVDYTLPGLLPPPAPLPSSEEATGLSFRGRLRMLRPQQRVDWRELLRLDLPPVAASVIGPPPRPPGLEPQDGITQRAAWNRMLDRHAGVLGRDAGAGVQRMMALLLNLRDLQQAVAARHLSAPQE